MKQSLTIFVAGSVSQKEVFYSALKAKDFTFRDYLLDKRFLNKVDNPTLPHIKLTESFDAQNIADLVIYLIDKPGDIKLNKFEIACMDLESIATKDQDKFLDQLSSVGISRHNQLLFDKPYIILSTKHTGVYNRIINDSVMIYRFSLLVLQKLNLTVLSTGYKPSEKVQMWIVKKGITYKEFAYYIHTKVGDSSNFVQIADPYTLSWKADKMHSVIKERHIILFK